MKKTSKSNSNATRAADKSAKAKRVVVKDLQAASAEKIKGGPYKPPINRGGW